MSKKLHITIKVPKKDDENKDIIKLRGTTINLAKAKEELENCKETWKSQLEEEYLRSYTCPVDVPLVFHGKLIGPKGDNINAIQKKFNVKINLKKQQAGIEITGLQEDVHNCVDEISKFVDDLESHVQKDVEIDSRIHYRLIGTKGSKLRGFMREHNVDLTMPRKNDEDYANKKNIITVSGSNDNVETAIMELFNLESEYLQEEGDEEVDDRFKPSVPAQECWRDQEQREKEKKESQKNRGGQKKGQQYKVVDAPWSEQQKNTKKDAFPTLGGDSNGSAPSYMGAWGAKRN